MDGEHPREQQNLARVNALAARYHSDSNRNIIETKREHRLRRINVRHIETEGPRSLSTPTARSQSWKPWTYVVRPGAGPACPDAAASPRASNRNHGQNEQRRPCHPFRVLPRLVQRQASAKERRKAGKCTESARDDTKTTQDRQRRRNATIV